MEAQTLCGHCDACMPLRFENLKVLSIESKRAKGLDMDLVVDEFDGRVARRPGFPEKSRIQASVSRVPAQPSPGR